MPDIGKVIKAVECRANGNGQQGCIGWDVDCPYSFDHAFCDMNQLLLDALALLKEQETKTGHWIEQEDYNLDTYYDCSVCGESWSTVEGTPWENGMNYCPHCGAKMEGR